MHRTRVPILLGCAAAGLFACKSPEEHVREADDQVYGILSAVSSDVTGEAKTFPIDPKADTLRSRLIAAAGDADVLELDIPTALDVAAENSREFARQKESLYRAALSLTRQQHEFEVKWGGGTSARVSGEGSEATGVVINSDLSASARSTSGARIVAGFANTLLKSLVSGGVWGESSVLSLSLTQPLLSGFGENITREPLTQSERDVVYAVRSFERFRATLSVDIVSSYLSVLQQMRNLESQRANFKAVQTSAAQSRELYQEGRRNIEDFGRARQDELSAQARVVNAENSLRTALDSFKLQLGLPMDVEIHLDLKALDRLESLGIGNIDLDEGRAIELALARRYDYRNTLDQVEDAARQIVVAEDSLRSILDFSAAIDIPTEAGKSLVFDWSKIGWATGFNLDLALDRLPERNAYRTALITLNDRIRSREETEDRIKQELRRSLRDVRTRVTDFEIQSGAVVLAEQRVDVTREKYMAGRTQQFEVLDAQNSLLAAQIAQTGALVNYAVARLDLLRDLEGVSIEPKGLRLDLSLPLPDGAQDTRDAARTAAKP